MTDYDLSTVGLEATWRVADNLSQILLNGNVVHGSVTSTWFTDRNLSVATGSADFLAGLNTLTIIGTSLNSRWDGFWFDGLVDGQKASVPEPTSLALFGLGLLGFGFSRMKKKS